MLRNKKEGRHKCREFLNRSVYAEYSRNFLHTTLLYTRYIPLCSMNNESIFVPKTIWQSTSCIMREMHVWKNRQVITCISSFYYPSVFSLGKYVKN